VAKSSTPTPRLELDSDPQPVAGEPKRPSRLLELLLLTATRSQNHVAPITIVAGLVLVVGTTDFLAGVGVSLAPFYLIPIALSVSWLGWRAGCVTAVSCTAVRVTDDLVNGGYRHPDVAGWNRGIELFMYLVVVFMLHAFISLLREIDERVRQRTAALQKVIAERAQLQTELLEISRRERAAIGRDLHDGLGQDLTAASIAANMLAGNLAAGGYPAAKDARNVSDMLQSAIGTTRTIARGLLLAAVEPNELLPELDELAAALSHEFPVTFRFVHRGVSGDRLSAGIASHVFYIAQEAARNAARHAKATSVEISLFVDERGLELAVTDNGRGLPSPNGRSSGMGQRVMAHRTELIGGEFSLGPGSEGGTTVRCRVPLPSSEAALAAR
jgi:signal transduction histidine kinase